MNKIQEMSESKSQVTRIYFSIIAESKYKIDFIFNPFNPFSIDETIFNDEIKPEQELNPYLEFNEFLTLI